MIISDSYANGAKSGEVSGKGGKEIRYQKDLGGLRQPNRFAIPGIPPKSLVGIPWRFALAMQTNGWILRSDIIWAKPNPLPESVKDRPTRSHEHLFLFVKNRHYYYDKTAIEEPSVYPDLALKKRSASDHKSYPSNDRFGHNGMRKAGDVHSTRNARDVWTIPTEPYLGGHYAPFPTRLIERCILAGCPSGGIILDPFVGSGTTLVVAKRLNRQGIGIDLNLDYLHLAQKRIVKESPHQFSLFSS